MKGRKKFFALFSPALLFSGMALGQDLDRPFAPGETFSISHTPMNAKLVPLDCDAKKVPIHSYKHAGNEATFLIPEDSPTCTYEVLGTRIKVIKPEKASVDEKPASVASPKQAAPPAPK